MARGVAIRDRCMDSVICKDLRKIEMGGGSLRIRVSRWGMPMNITFQIDIPFPLSLFCMMMTLFVLCLISRFILWFVVWEFIRPKLGIFGYIQKLDFCRD